MCVCVWGGGGRGGCVCINSYCLLGDLGGESRRDQEEGGELDSQEKASPEEIKSREVVLG